MTDDEKLKELKAKGYNPNYIPKIEWISLLLTAIIIVAALGLSWYQYGFSKHFPAQVESTIIREDSILFDLPFKNRITHIGDAITILAYDGKQYFWVEKEDGTRGLLFRGSVDNWQDIRDIEDISKYLLTLENYSNIGKEQFCEEYLAHSFEENETNNWPALYKYTLGDTTYATYHIRMWDGTECKIPTVLYVENKAVAVTSYKDAPFEGNKKWLRCTPWAEWIYSSAFFHFHWDRPMIEKEKITLSTWPWIFRVPTKLFLLLLSIVILLLWVTVICSPLLIFLYILIKLRYPFWAFSNGQLTLLLIVASAFSIWFYMPFFILNHGTFVSIIIMGAIFGLLFGVSFAIIDNRCEKCRCVGFIDIIKKEYDHSEFSTDTIEEKDIEKSNSTLEIYNKYKITYEEKIYNHHRICSVCNTYTLEKDIPGEKEEIKRELIGTRRVRITQSHSTPSSTGNETNRIENPFTHSTHSGLTCGYCTYYDGSGWCAARFAKNEITPDTPSCGKFESR